LRSAGGVSYRDHAARIRKPGRPGVGSVVRVAYAVSDGIYLGRAARGGVLATLTFVNEPPSRGRLAPFNDAGQGPHSSGTPVFRRPAKKVASARARMFGAKGAAWFNLAML